MYEVVYSDRYVALGGRTEDGGAVVRALLWTSIDGARWSLNRSAEIGDCSGEGPVCGHAAGLVATPGGLILIGDVYAAGENAFFGALASTDGRTWNRIEPETFDGDLDAYVAAALPWNDGVVALVGSGARPMTAWQTSDGASWERFANFGDSVQTGGSLAAHEELLVAAEGESASGGFRTTIWTAEEARPFERATAFDDVIATKLASAGPAGLVAVGHDEGRPQVVASGDGHSWYRTAPGLPQIECSPYWLAGGASTALYVGSCGVWIARAP